MDNLVKVLLVLTVAFSISSCNSTKKQIEAVSLDPCMEVVKKHLIANHNGFNITKMEQEGDRLYIFGQVSGCNRGQYSIMWNDIVASSEPPQVTVEFETFEAGLCDQMVERIWCMDLSRFKAMGSSQVVLHIAKTKDNIILEF
jgi:hypothetical protein